MKNDYFYNGKSLQKLRLLIFYSTITYSTILIINKFFVASFSGFSSIGMEYTRKGKVFSNIITLSLLSLQLIVLVIRLIGIYHHKYTYKYYLLELLVFFAGVLIGIGCWKMAPPNLYDIPIISDAIYELRSSDWLKKPIP